MNFPKSFTTHKLDVLQARLYGRNWRKLKNDNWWKPSQDLGCHEAEFENESKIFYILREIIRKAQQLTKPAGRRDEFLNIFYIRFSSLLHHFLEFFNSKNLSRHRELEFLMICVGRASTDSYKAEDSCLPCVDQGPACVDTKHLFRWQWFTIVSIKLSDVSELVSELWYLVERRGKDQRVLNQLSLKV